VVGLILLTFFCLTTQVIFGVSAFLVLIASLYLLWLSFSGAVGRVTVNASERLSQKRRRG
jgi:hypothetical protein